MRSRRSFLKKSFLGTAAIAVSGDNLFGSTSILDTITLIQEDLFPYTKELQSNSKQYIYLILTHNHISKKDKRTLISGVQKVNEETVKTYQQTYLTLDAKQRQETLKRISKEEWGEKWLQQMLTYIMEAVLGDPVYNVNQNENGWKWLNHKPGMPRPLEPIV